MKTTPRAVNRIAGALYDRLDGRQAPSGTSRPKDAVAPVFDHGCLGLLS